MISVPLHHLYFHHDFDGVVAASMVQASTENVLCLKPIQYHPNLHWLDRTLESGTAIVDFLYHPAAALWIDHHPTTFLSDSMRKNFKTDQYHVFSPAALSCPEVIVELPWFDNRNRWAEYLKWASIIDSASYESAAQANDLANPYLLLSHVISALSVEDDFSALVRAIGNCPIGEVLVSGNIKTLGAQVLREDAVVREHLSSRLKVFGQVTVLDQSDLPIPFRRYLPYEVHPQTRYGIGLYKSGDATIVSIGENPWNKSGKINLGQLCGEFGGGGRPSTAGVPMPTAAKARETASQLVQRINESIGNEG